MGRRSTSNTHSPGAQVTRGILLLGGKPKSGSTAQRRLRSKMTRHAYDVCRRVKDAFSETLLSRSSPCRQRKTCITSTAYQSGRREATFLLLQDLDDHVLPLLWHLLRSNSDQDVVKVLPYGGVLAHAGSSCLIAITAILLAIFVAGIQLLHFNLILFFSVTIFV